MADSQQGYVYLLQEREFVQNENIVFKFGRTANILERMSSYPKGSRLVTAELVYGDHKRAETEVLRLLREQFINRKDIGREYFEGDPVKMRAVICNYILSFSRQHYDAEDEIQAPAPSPVVKQKKRQPTAKQCEALAKGREKAAIARKEKKEVVKTEEDKQKEALWAAHLEKEERFKELSIQLFGNN